MSNYPKTAEDLANDYNEYIKDWILYNNTAKIDAHEFISSFYHKVLTKNTLEKFDPDYGVKFETWLSKVLQNHYYDRVNQSLKDNWISIQKFSDDEKDTLREDAIGYEDISFLDEIISNDTIEQLIRLINGIQDDRDRVLIKLKYYQKGQSQLIIIRQNDLDYIRSVSDLNDQEILQYIDDNAKDSYGLRDRNICELINIATGSINTFFQRAVRKWLKA